MSSLAANTAVGARPRGSENNRRAAATPLPKEKSPATSSSVSCARPAARSAWRYPDRRQRLAPCPGWPITWAMRRWPSASSVAIRSEEHTSELQSLMRHSYAVFCSKKQVIPPHQLHPSVFLGHPHIHLPQH